jgi:hypothetical protein
MYQTVLDAFSKKKTLELTTESIDCLTIEAYREVLGCSK